MNDRTAEEWQVLAGRFKAAVHAAMLVSVEEAEAMLNQWNRERTLMPILDPTLWVRTAGNESVGDVISAFVMFRREIEAARKEVTTD